MEIIIMELLWIPISMLAGLMQAVRTAAQKALSDHLSTWMTTYVRSIWGLPFMLAYLAVVLRLEGLGTPRFQGLFLFHCFMTGLTQVVATYWLILLFRRANFAVGTMLTKTDIMQAALIGSVLFSESISPEGWIAIILAVAGVVLMSVGKSRAALAQFDAKALMRSPSVLLGIGAGFMFALGYLFLREASLVLEQGSSMYRAAWSVVVVTSMQCVGVGVWLVITERGEFTRLPTLWRPSLFIGVTSAVGSIGWFTAMAMQNASYVKAVGQVEVVFTILISTLWFRERITWAEYAGMSTIVLAVLIFIL